MAQGQAVAIALETAKMSELTTLTRKHGRHRHWRSERAPFWQQPMGSIAGDRRQGWCVRGKAPPGGKW